MDLSKSGKLICKLRKSKGMTQKQLADLLGVEAKTVSKWETGHGFPDVSYVSELAEIFGVSEKILLSGDLILNAEEVGNMKKTKFYVCPHCGSIIQGTGKYEVICCGNKLEALQVKEADSNHLIKISDIENDFYIEFNHEMTKEHFIAFFAYVTSDRVMLIRMYPEQDSSVRFSKIYGGKLYYYCNKHGLFEYSEKRNQVKIQEKSQTKGQVENQSDNGNAVPNMTALISAFSRAYHFENSKTRVFDDAFVKKLFTDDEYRQIEKYISISGNDVKEYVNTQLAPTPLARAKFCEDSLQNALKTGTEQYVILGSGLDTFSLRNPDKNIDIFEIDRENVISDKLMRINRVGIKLPSNVHFIAADLVEDNLYEILEKNGFDKKRKTFFSCLGLLYYLTNEEVSDLFEQISDFAADGSTVVFDFADNHLFSSDIPRVKEMVKMAEASGTPMKSCFGYGELEMLLQKHNFLVYEFLNDKEIQSRYFFQSAGEMTAFEHINYVLAVLK